LIIPVGFRKIKVCTENRLSLVIIDYHCNFSKNERTLRDEVYAADSKLSETVLQQYLIYFTR